MIYTMPPRKQKSTLASSSRGSGSDSNPKRLKTNAGKIDLSGRAKPDYDDYIDSSDDDDIGNDGGVQTPSFKDESDDEFAEEHLDVKKVRLAREYLESIEAKGRGTHSDGDTDATSDDDEDENESEDVDQVISRKLQRKRLELEGTLEKNYADKVSHVIHKMHSQLNVTAATTVTHEHGSDTPELEAAAWVKAGIVQPFRGKGHDLSPTCLALVGTTDDRVVSGSKDHSVLLWDVETQSQIATLCDRWQPTLQGKQSNKTRKTDKSVRTSKQVLALACSDDGKFVAVGRRDATVSIYDMRIAHGKNDCFIQTFTGHKDAITGLAFRSQSHQLFTASNDRCVRHYNLDEMLYLETLYGHQFGITGIDCHRAERPISVGSDRTARAWKIAEDTHLIFRGGSKVAAADTITVVKDNSFVTGHQDGSVALWSTEKKRAVATISQAHGAVRDNELGRGIVSINCVKGSDLIATGSSDGYLRFWKISPGGSSGAGSNGTTKKENRGGSLDTVGAIPIHGFINAIAISTRAKFCIVAAGQEHRCGRWERVPRAKNRIAMIPLVASADDTDVAKTNALPNGTSVDFEALD